MFSMEKRYRNKIIIIIIIIIIIETGALCENTSTIICTFDGMHLHCCRELARMKMLMKQWHDLEYKLFCFFRIFFYHIIDHD